MNTIDDTQDTQAEKTINVQKAPSKGKKILTILTGVPKEVEQKILKDLKDSLGCGGIVNKKTGYMQLQGDYVDKIEGLLAMKLSNFKVVFGSKK